MKKRLLPKMLAAACILAGLTSRAQVKVGNNPTVINSNPISDIESINKGVLLPGVMPAARGNPGVAIRGSVYKDRNIDSYKLSIIK